MAETIKGIKQAAIWHRRYGPHAPKVGDVAPDFELVDVEGKQRVRLSDFRERKPVALIFGSFT